jgi:hypothetical protein
MKIPIMIQVKIFPKTMVSRILLSPILVVGLMLFTSDFLISQNSYPSKGSIKVESKISHKADPDTYIQFNMDRVTLSAGEKLVIEGNGKGEGSQIKIGGAANCVVNINDQIYSDAKSGNVGIGTELPEATLHVAGTFQIGSKESLEDIGKFELGCNAAFLPSVDNQFDLGSATHRWDDIYATNGIIQTSDQRDKTNIKPLNYGLSEVLLLKPVSFQWENDANENTKLGLVAQDLLTVIPETVKTHDQAIVNEATGEMEVVELERLGVYYSDLIPVLIKAIQEQQDIIEKKDTEIAKLKVKTNENEAKISELFRILETKGEGEEAAAN